MAAMAAAAAAAAAAGASRRPQKRSDSTAGSAGGGGSGSGGSGRSGGGSSHKEEAAAAVVGATAAAVVSAAAATALSAGLVADARPAPKGGMSGGGGDQVAVWEVPLQDGVHRVEFEHGTTSGKRILRVDGREILHREWMFKLVGDEEFSVGGARCVLRVEPVGGFSYSYELLVNGRPFEQHSELMNRATKTWAVHIGTESYRVVLERDTLDIWANGKKLETTGEFVEDGTETHFTLGDTPAYIKAVTSGRRREGLIHSLIVGDTVIAPLRTS